MSRLLLTRRGYDSEDYTDSEGDSIGSYTTSDEDETDSELEVTDSEIDSEEETDDYEEESDEDEEVYIEEEKVESTVIQPKDEPKAHVNEDLKSENENEDIKLPASENSIPVSENSTPAPENSIPVPENSIPVPENSIPTEEIQYEVIKEKRIQEHREYRRKLAEDPSFVPYVGLFWSHDDRYREDSFAETRPASGAEASNNPHFNPNPYQKSRSKYDQSMDPLMYKKWDHSGYEEILREEEANERRRRNMSELDDQTEIKSYTHQHSFSQRGRGHRGGRGGYQNHGHRQPHRPKDNWSDLNSSPKIVKVVENSSWANVTPETLQEHGKSTFDVNNKPAVIDEDIPVGITTTAILNPVVTAWGSVDRVQESETLGNTAVIETHQLQLTDHSPTIKASWEDTNKVTEPSGWDTVETSAQQDWNNVKTPIETPAQPRWNNNTTSWDDIPEPVIDNQSTHWTQSNNTSSETAHKEWNTAQDSRCIKNEETFSNNWDDTSKKTTSDDHSRWNTSEKLTASGWNNNDTTVDNWEKTPATKNKIPIEEKASSSWAKMSAEAPPEKPFIRPSFQNKYDSNDKPRRRSYKNISGNFKQNEDQEFKEEKPWNPSAESSGWSTPVIENKTQTTGWRESKTTEISNGWGESKATEISNGWGEIKATEISNGWGEIKVTEVNNGWGETKATEVDNSNGWKEAETKQDEAPSWDTEKPVEKPVVPVADVSTTTSWNVSPAIVESSPSWTVEEQPKARRMGWEDQPKTRADGWSTSQSNNSTDWNADKKANQARFNYNKEPKKSRGYFSQKMEVPSPPVVEEEYQHDDEDSDVEIILEADEEPDWVKNEQILGMTAPKEKESPKASISPPPEANFRKSQPTAYKARRNFDDNWRQRDEVNSDADEQPQQQHQQRQQQQYHQTRNVPMYYPQPHHQMNGGNITYLPMIPNGPNGSPMYAMPYPMGMPSSPVAVSSSPNNSVGGDSSPHMSQNTKFYPPFIHGPNGLQLPPGYEANGMVYYGMDPSAMYAAAPPQPYYYYAPMPANTGPMYSSHRSSPNHPEEQDEDGWGPLPDVEEQWNIKHHTSSH